MSEEHAEFFAGLPADKLLPMEHGVRKALLKALTSNGGRFPLIEWIDRRIGAEIESRRNEEGVYEIVLRDNGIDDAPIGGLSNGGGGPKEATKEAFFASLSPDEFAQPEEDMREAIFEFLATWTSRELATLGHLSNFPVVQQARGRFLPKGVSLKDWIEHRIGGEIEFRNVAPGVEQIHLTPVAQSAVKAKYQQIAARGMPPMGFPPGPPGMPFGMGPPPMMPGRDMMGPMGGRGGPVAERVAQPAGEDAWFASLPANKLLPGELALREAFVNWINRWEEERPANRPPGSPPHLADCGKDNDIRRTRSNLLPAKVKFIKWIERRIGGEIELRPIDNGQHEVHFRNEADPAPAAKRKGREERSGGGSQEEKDAFFATLPEDEFSNEEEALRAAILDFLGRWDQSSPPTVADMHKDEEIKAARAVCLPKGSPVSFKEWIDKRIGGEIETRADSSCGVWILGLRGQLGEAAPQNPATRKRQQPPQGKGAGRAARQRTE